MTLTVGNREQTAVSCSKVQYSPANYVAIHPTHVLIMSQKSSYQVGVVSARLNLQTYIVVFLYKDRLPKSLGNDYYCLIGPLFYLSKAEPSMLTERFEFLLHKQSKAIITHKSRSC